MWFTLSPGKSAFSPSLPPVIPRPRVGFLSSTTLSCVRQERESYIAVSLKNTRGELLCALTTFETGEEECGLSRIPALEAAVGMRTRTELYKLAFNLTKLSQ